MGATRATGVASAAVPLVEIRLERSMAIKPFEFLLELVELNSPSRMLNSPMKIGLDLAILSCLLK